MTLTTEFGFRAHFCKAILSKAFVSENRSLSEMSGIYRILRHWFVSLLERYVFDAGKILSHRLFLKKMWLTRLAGPRSWKFDMK